MEIEYIWNKLWKALEWEGYIAVPNVKKWQSTNGENGYCVIHTLLKQ
jgi:hypothetical protein